MQRTLSFQYIDLQYHLIDAVLEISRLQLGNDFITKEDLLPYINDDSKTCQLLRLESIIVGFSLMEIAPKGLIGQKMNVEQAWLDEYLKDYDSIGYRSVTAVHPAYEGKGIASALVQNGLHYLSQKVSVVLCEAWKSSHTHIANILERNGYTALKEIPYYWTADSIKLQYECSHCGAPPCACTAVIYAAFFDKKVKEWWERPGLRYQQNQLYLNRVNLLEFTKNKPTPHYIYDADRIIVKYNYLFESLAEHNDDKFRIFYAIKANRHPALLTHLRIRTNIGIDVCSPNELKLALQMGFEEPNISYTGTSLSNKDLAFLQKHFNININLGSISSIRRFHALAPNRPIGIRINTETGMAYAPDLEYAGAKISKFGIYENEWQQLKDLAEVLNLKITGLHCHSGSGFLTDQLPKLTKIFEAIDRFLGLFPQIKTLNLGGGLGVPQKQDDQALDLKKWASLVGDFAKKRGLSLAIEPGDFLVKDAGVLISEVTTVEKKSGQLMVGLDCGMNINNEYAYYNMNLEAVPLQQNPEAKIVETTLYGNINEPIDLFSKNKPMYRLKEGQRIALLNSGGYGASSSSNHCMRGDFEEYIISK